MSVFEAVGKALVPWLGERGGGRWCPVKRALDGIEVQCGKCEQYFQVVIELPHQEGHANGCPICCGVSEYVPNELARVLYGLGGKVGEPVGFESGRA